MLLVEILPNANCDAVDQRVYNNVEPPHPVHGVRLEPEPGRAQWFAVTAWSEQGPSGPAMAARVEDSGSGIVTLVYGGEAGLRLKPDGDAAAWSLSDKRQWGAPFFLLADPGDVR